MAAITKREDNWNGSIRQRSNGSFEARISIDGVRKSFYGATETEAKRKMQKYRNEGVRRKNVKTISLNEYIQNYLLVYKLGIVKNSTYDRYESTFEHHIKPQLGMKKLSKITSSDIQKIINQKVNPINNSDVPLSYSSVKKIIELLNLVFKYAMAQQDISINPMLCVVMPRKGNFLVKTKEMFALEDDELVKIKKIADSTRNNGDPICRYAFLFMILLNTGLRVGELLALKWNDVDLGNKLISINKSIMSNVKERDSHGNVLNRSNMVSSTKTINGHRVIPLNDQAFEYLIKCHNYNINKNINSEFVAFSSAGTPTTARNLQRALDSVFKKANVRHCGLHILRHTFGSVLLKKGVEISVVSKLMGHSSTKITYDEYIHVFREQELQAINLINII